ncbi:MFS transporter [Candidatus Nanopelagicales bacterium]|nr:MFS transporter [Candidatus Nanopelagicales bacterium]
MSSEPRAEAPLGRQRWWTLVGATGAASLTLVDQTIVAIALPTIQAELGMSAGALQWVVTGYILAFAATVALAGRLGDSYGHRRIYLTGIAVFTSASILAAMSPYGAVLLVARVVQGVGGALMLPSAISLVFEAFPKDGRGKAVGIYVSVSQFFLAAGPILGGVLLSVGSWRLVFLVNVPVAILAFTISAIVKPSKQGLASAPRGWSAAILLAAGTGCLVFALQNAHSLGWGSPILWGLMVAGAALTSWFARTQLATSEPLIDLRLFAQQKFRMDALILFVLQFVIIPATVWAAIFLQDGVGLSPLLAGFGVFPYAGSLLVGALAGGRLFDAHGIRAPTLWGIGCMALGTVGFAVAASALNYWLLLPGLLVGGFGAGLSFPALNTDALGQAKDQTRGQASGLLQTIRQSGGAFGAAIVGSIVLAQSASHGLSAAVAGGFLAMGGLLVVVLIQAARRLRGSG